MAYNYDEFLQAANNAGMLNRFSQTDLNAARTNPEYGYSLLRMYQNRDKATTAEQRLLADETANQLRRSYGVNSGQTGPVGMNMVEPYRTAIRDASVKGLDSTGANGGVVVAQNPAAESAKTQTFTRWKR